MKTSVASYNACKGVSTVLTVGAPIVTLASCSDMFVHRSETAISAAGIFALLIAALFFKDKIAENFKSPSALVVAIAIFTLVVLVENIILPVKYVCIATIASCGVDELTFKRIYRQIEKHLPNAAADAKHIGFIFSTTKKLQEGGEMNEN